MRGHGGVGAAASIILILTLNYCIDELRRGCARGCAGVRGGARGARAAGGGRLHGRLRVAVAGQTLHVDVVRRKRVTRRVGVVDAGRVREPLGQRRLLAQRLRQRRVRQRAARVQPLPERVHHADLRRARRLVPSCRGGMRGAPLVLTTRLYSLYRVRQRATFAQNLQ